MFRSAEAFFRPRSVAIVGASETGAGGWPRAIFANLEYAGFPAEVYLINPRREELWGRKVYPDFASLPEPVDLALTIVPAEAIPGVLADGVAHGLKSALIYAARFGEGGDAEGEKRAAAIRALCDDKGLVVCGPNCMGAMAFPKNLLFYPAVRIRGMPVGSTGVAFQSGGTFMFWLQRAAERGLGFSYAVSSGNELNLDLADYINFMVDDPDTKMIACMVEGIRRPEAFMEAARRALEAEKPIVMVKLGRSAAGQAAAQSHTGALASDDAVFEAVCEKYGVVRAYSLDEMIDICLVLNQRRWAKGPNIGMAGYSGGGKGLFLDYAADEGAVMGTVGADSVATVEELIDYGLSGQNPVDCGAGIASRLKDVTKVCLTLANDPGIDVFAMQGQLPTTPDDPTDHTIFSDVVAGTDKPVIAYTRVSQNVTPDGLAFQAKAGMPFVQTLPAAVRSLQALIRYSAARDRGVVALPEAAGERASLDGAAFQALLGKSGLTPPASAMGATATEAAVDGFLVQEMVSGVEVILGVREDPQFGPFMVAGLGGVMVEAMRDVAFRMLPVTADAAAAMLDELRGKALLGEFRGRPARDRGALIAAMVGLSGLFLDHRDFLADLEVNPLIVGAVGEGVRAVDVRPVFRQA